MWKVLFFLTALVLACTCFLFAMVEDHMTDTMETNVGPVQIDVLGHASLRLMMGSMMVYVDPAMDFYRKEDFGKADLVLVTHSHRDHFQADLIDKLKKPDATVFITKECAETYPNGRILGNGDEKICGEILVQAVPAYNIVHKRENGEPFHPKGSGNGYVIHFGGKRIYISGDTELIPEMESLTGVDAVFLPANLPYTMDADMFIKAVDLLAPGRVYPYHYKFGTSVLPDILPVLRERKIDVRVNEKQLEAVHT